MKAFLKNGETISVSQLEYEDYQEMRSQKKDRNIILAGETRSLDDIRFIGDWCHNEKCHSYQQRGIKAHPEGEVCEYDLSGSCIECGKEILRRDVDYSTYKFGTIYCREHAPLKDLKGNRMVYGG